MTFVQANSRGQITIPKRIRKNFRAFDVLQLSLQNERIVLEPLQTRDEFLEELEERSHEAKKGKTYGLDEVEILMKKHYAAEKKV